MHDERPDPRETADYFHLDDFYGLGMLSARYHQQKFSRHTHEGFCIGVIEDGVQQFFRTGSNHYAPAGDIILVNSDEIHTGSSALETGWAYRAIYPTPDMLDTLMRDLKTTDQRFVPWFTSAVVHDPGLSAQLRKARQLLIDGGRPADISVQCGFTDQSHFTRHFKRAMGISPGKFIHNRLTR